MIFISDEKRIVAVYHKVPRSRPGAREDELPRRTGYGRYVLELPAGAARSYGLENGQSLDFNGG